MDILSLLSQMLCLILHVTDADSFPKPLSKAEEEGYIEKLMQGDDNARKLLIEHNLRLVAHVVKKYYTTDTDKDDLISIGTIGLIKGVNSFKPQKGVKLATYCARCIDNEILMYLRKNKKLRSEVSIDQALSFDSDGNELHLEDIIGTGEDITYKEYEKKVKFITGFCIISNNADRLWNESKL